MSTLPSPTSEVPEAPPADARSTQIRAALLRTLPAALGYVPLGIPFGMLVAQSGLPWWMAPGLSMAAYSGSAELLMVSLASVGTPLLTIAVATFLVNSRHLFYAFSFPLHLVRGRGQRLYSMYALVDEAYALSVTYPSEWTGLKLLTMQVMFQATWVVSGLLGLAIGTSLPFRIEGLEFALCAMFITLALDAARSRQEIPSLLLAGLSLAVSWVLTPGQLLIASLTGFVLLLCVRHLVCQSSFMSETGKLARGTSH